MIFIRLRLTIRSTTLLLGVLRPAFEEHSPLLPFKEYCMMTSDLEDWGIP
jgi:hypothetical protein